MRDRAGQFDMAHALATDAGQRHLDAALFADDALVLHPLVLAAKALVVLGRTEDTGAEQAVALRLEGPVVDGLGLLDLPERPGPDLFGAGEGDADPVEGRGGLDRVEDIQDFLVHGSSSSSEIPEADREGLTAPPPALAREAGRPQVFSSSTLRPRERISLTSTLKLSGMPASKVSSPRTMDS